MGQIILQFALFGKKGELIGYETHMKNDYGIIQIYHRSLRGDFMMDNPDEDKLVREGYFIPASDKKLIS